jgi:hypothetical protein
MKNIITDALIKTTITLTIIRIVVALLTRTIEESNFYKEIATIPNNENLDCG